MREEAMLQEITAIFQPECFKLDSIAGVYDSSNGNVWIQGAASCNISTWYREMEPQESEWKE